VKNEVFEELDASVACESGQANPLGLICSSSFPRIDKQNSSSPSPETNGKEEHACCGSLLIYQFPKKNTPLGQGAKAEPLFG
jgi:hypothetical protein